MTTSENTAAALMRLERRIGRLSVFCGLLGVSLLLSFLMPMSEVKARRFVLLDDAGQQRGMWRVRNQNAALILQDTSGIWRAVINVNDDHSELWLSRPGGTRGVRLHTTDGSSELDVSGERDEGHARAAASADGPRLVILDESGGTVASLP